MIERGENQERERERGERKRELKTGVHRESAQGERVHRRCGVENETQGSQMRESRHVMPQMRDSRPAFKLGHEKNVDVSSASR